MLAMIPYLIGYIIITCSQFVLGDTSKQVVVLDVGRFFTGVALGWSCLVVPVSDCYIHGNCIYPLSACDYDVQSHFSLMILNQSFYSPISNSIIISYKMIWILSIVRSIVTRLVTKLSDPVWPNE